MTKECKQQFTLRITQANSTQLIVILYEMTLQYLADGFFNFSKKVKTLKLYEIEIPMRQMVELADNCIDKLSKADLRRDDIQLRKSVCSFTPEKMAGKEMLIGAVCTGKYDLRPDFNNFDRLT